MLGGIFEKNNIKDKIQTFDKKITESNFWKDKFSAKKILKEKKFFEDISNNFNSTVNELENFEQLLELALKENDIEAWEDNFDGSQWTSLKELIIQLHNKYPEAEICGHYKFSDTKKCPSFDVEEWKKIELDWIEGDYLPNDERD